MNFKKLHKDIKGKYSWTDYLLPKCPCMLMAAGPGDWNSAAMGPLLL